MWICFHRTWAAGARPSGAPGWPDLALATWSTDSSLRVLIDSLSISVYLEDIVRLFLSLDLWFFS